MPGLTPLRGYPYPFYGEPADFPMQAVAFAMDVDGDVDALVTAQSAALNAASARVTASAALAIVPSVSTVLTFAVEAYDNAAMSNLGVNNDRLTFTQLGVYLIHAECVWAGNGDATVGGRRLFLNASVEGNVAFDTRRGAASQIQESSITYLYKATVINSFIRASVVHTSASNVNVGVRSFSATRVSN